MEESDFEALLNDPKFVEDFLRQGALEDARAPHCPLCHDRCDPPFGNGYLCLVCLSRPTSADMAIIVY